MWGMLVVFVMTALVGFYRVPTEHNLNRVEEVKARELAESMGLYRKAVSDYYTKYDKLSYVVRLAELKSEGLVPQWSELYTNSSTSIWSNYRDNDGTIYVFAASTPPVNIVTDLMQLSRNSLTVNVYRRTGSYLYSPIDGRYIPHPSLSGLSIPDGAPVWLAARN